MPRVGEFCPSNIARLLLGVVISVTLLTAIGFWLYNAPGRGASIEQPTSRAARRWDAISKSQPRICSLLKPRTPN
jgi:hypothetical protein